MQMLPVQPQALASFSTPHAVADVKTISGQVDWVLKLSHPSAWTGVACFSTPLQFQSKGRVVHPGAAVSLGPPL
jgi:hypothetical protein